MSSSESPDNSAAGVHAVILAGGSGTRFWPLSRELDPKQFFRFFGGRSLIHQTIERILPLVPQEQVMIVTGERLKPEIRSHLAGEEPPFNEVRSLVEPAARNTAPAIALAAAAIHRKGPDGIAIVMPSDHVVESGEPFLRIIRRAIGLARRDLLVTIGLRPTSPETGFGYIKSGAPIEPDTQDASIPAYQVAQFVEKPDLARAQQYMDSGDYYWNSGMFVFRVARLLEEIERYSPEMRATVEWLAAQPEDEWTSEEARARFAAVDSISIDYAVMERADRVAVVPADFKWSDVGSFTALEDFIEKDEHGNALFGEAMEIDTEGSLVFADKHLVALLGMKDVVVIDTHDATLVMPKDRAQDVRMVVERIKEQGREEHIAHRTSMRPWGSFTILEEGPGFKIKIIEVKVGGKLSHQLHHHRSEHWVVLTGTAHILRGDQEVILHPNESTFIPVSMEHQLENRGMIPLKIIEVQSGEYLSEDDIVRLSDIYKR